MLRQSAKSIGCSKNFRGNQALNKAKKVDYWVTQLCDELEERLENDKKQVIFGQLPKLPNKIIYLDFFKFKNQREPTVLVVHITNEAGTFSKQTATNMSKCEAKKLKALALELMSGFNRASNKYEDWFD